MSSGYINLYFGNDAVPELASFEKMFGRIGLRLENPSTHQVLALAAAGDQVLASRDEIARY